MNKQREEQLIKLAQEAGMDTYGGKILAKNVRLFADAVEKIAIDSANHKWISVKDRLPIEGDDIKDGYNSIKVIVSRGQVVHECEYVAWGKNCVGTPKNEFCHEGCDYITHWMPLPPVVVIQERP